MHVEYFRAWVEEDPVDRVQAVSGREVSARLHAGGVVFHALRERLPPKGACAKQNEMQRYRGETHPRPRAGIMASSPTGGP